MDELTDSHIAVTLGAYGVSADAKLCEQIREYVALLLRWNEKISLTTIENPDEVLRFHFGESFFAAGSVPINDGRLADVGSGAGFPGIPLAIVSPELEVTLIESNAKKAAFLSEVVRTLGLNRLRVLRSRMEEIGPDLRNLDFITARALGNYDALLRWASSRLSGRGNVVLWLGDEEVSALSGQASWSWRNPLLIPGSRNRFLLVGSPKHRE